MDTFALATLRPRFSCDPNAANVARSVRPSNASKWSGELKARLQPYEPHGYPGDDGWSSRTRTACESPRVENPGWRNWWIAMNRRGSRRRASPAEFAADGAVGQRGRVPVEHDRIPRSHGTAPGSRSLVRGGHESLDEAGTDGVSAASSGPPRGNDPCRGRDRDGQSALTPWSPWCFLSPRKPTADAGTFARCLKCDAAAQTPHALKKIIKDVRNRPGHSARRRARCGRKSSGARRLPARCSSPGRSRAWSGRRRSEA